MGSNQFQREYIEYLQDRNSELLNKLSHMKENYENKIFSKDMSKHYLESALEDIMNVCTALPQEIDLFFEKMTGAMEVLTNILLKKSEMVQLVDKISRTINPSKDVDINPGIGLLPSNEGGSEKKPNKKVGTVKVSPMINGHVISTDPRIYLSRISNEFLRGRRNESRQLSPIVETSPDPDPSDVERPSLREIRLPVERLTVNKQPPSVEESPKRRIRGHRTWKKSLSLNKQGSPEATPNRENEDNKREVKAKKNEQRSSATEADPLEGPSWLYDENNHNSDFIDYRRRKHRFASVFDRNQDFVITEPRGQKKERQSEVKKRESKFKRGSAQNFEYKDCGEVSEDYISESSSEDEEDNSFFKKKLQENSRKNLVEDSSDENDFSEFEVSPKKKLKKSSPKTTEPNTSIHKSDSNYEADSEENSTKRKSSVKTYRKRSSKTVSEEAETDQSPGVRSSPRFTTQFKKEKSETPEMKTPQKVQKKKSKSKSGNKKSTQDKKCLRGMAIEYEDDTGENETEPKQSQKKTPERQKTDTTKVKSEFFEFLIPPETEGRKRRKAAPTNLSEPSLNTKLRRE